MNLPDELLILIGLFLLGMAWLGWLFIAAPEGYQDGDGFHRRKARRKRD